MPSRQQVSNSGSCSSDGLLYGRSVEDLALAGRSMLLLTAQFCSSLSGSLSGKFAFDKNFDHINKVISYTRITQDQSQYLFNGICIGFLIGWVVELN